MTDAALVPFPTSPARRTRRFTPAERAAIARAEAERRVRRVEPGPDDWNRPELIAHPGIRAKAIRARDAERAAESLARAVGDHRA